MAATRTRCRLPSHAGPPRRSRGLAAVEAVVLLPVYLLLAFGVAEFGRALYQYVTLTAATRASARYLASNALYGSTGVVLIDAALTNRVRNLAVYGNTAGTGAAVLPGLTPANVTVSDQGGNNVAVATAYRYSPIVGDQLPSFGTGAPIRISFTLRAQVSMRAI